MSRITMFVVAALLALGACAEPLETQETTQAVEFYQSYLESKYVTFYVDDVPQFRFYFDGNNAVMIDLPADPAQVLRAFGIAAHLMFEYEAEIRYYSGAPE